MPGIARTIGRVIRQFRSAQDQVTKVIRTEVYDPLKDLEPIGNPFAGLKLDDILDPKKDAEKKLPAEKDADTSDEGSPEKGLKAGSGEQKKTVEAAKPKRSELEAALKQDAEKRRALKKKAADLRIEAAVMTDSTTDEAEAEAAPKESFAERRARLEAELAEKKQAEQEAKKQAKRTTKKPEEEADPAELESESEE